ncbi:MAG: hypothetical protein HY770_07890 [Chitinivibrionia bacterium]|nr:hypothetical protein [Chitinivibrionia bacterium]
MKLSIACFLTCALSFSLAARDTDFLMLEKQKTVMVVNKDKGGIGEDQLSEHKGIKTEGYTFARVFYQVSSKDPHNENDGKLTGNNFAELSWCHEFPGGSYEIDSKKTYSRSTTHIYVTAEFPVYGNETKMTAVGALPDGTYEITCTVYLIK